MRLPTTHKSADPMVAHLAYASDERRLADEWADR